MPEQLAGPDSDKIGRFALHKIPTKGIQFMLFIARFEYALKETGYCHQNGNRLDVNWDAFARERLTNAFYDWVVSSEAAPTLLKEPPKRQILSGGKLGWERVEPPTDLPALIVAIRRVRNNLVHGGKSGDEDHERSDWLIAESIAILEQVLRECPDMRACFEGRF